MSTPGASASPGDWTVTGVESLADTTYLANGSIVVEAGGVLTVTNATIEFNLTVEGGYNITVQPGGRLVLDRATVRSAVDGRHYNFLVSGRLEVHGSDISDMRGDAGLGGLEITGGDALIEDSSIHHNRYFGLFLRSGSPVVRRTTFESNVVAISILPGATPTLEDLVIRNSTSFGIKVSNANPVIRNLTVTGSSNFAVGAIGGRLDIQGCRIVGGFVGIDAVQATTGRIEACDILQVGTALRAQDSPVELRNSTIFSAQVGVNATRSAVEVAGNRFTDVGVGVRVAGPISGGSGVFGGEAVHNEFNGSGTALEIHRSSFFVENNTYGPLLTSYRLFHDVTLEIVDRAGLPVARAGVTIKAADGTTVFTGVTDNDGKVTASLEEYRESADGTKVMMTPHQIEILRGSELTTSEVNATADTTLKIELKDPASPTTPLGVTREGLLLFGAVFLVLAFVSALSVRVRSRRRTKGKKQRGAPRTRAGPRGGR